MMTEKDTAVLAIISDVAKMLAGDTSSPLLPGFDPGSDELRRLLAGYRITFEILLQKREELIRIYREKLDKEEEVEEK